MTRRVLALFHLGLAEMTRRALSCSCHVVQVYCHKQLKDTHRCPDGSSDRSVNRVRSGRWYSLGDKFVLRFVNEVGSVCSSELQMPLPRHSQRLELACTPENAI